MFRATLKHLRARKLRLVTTGIAVLLGVAFITGTLILTDTITSTFDTLFTDVFKGTDAEVRAVEPFDADQGGGSTRPRIDANWVDKVAAVPGVDHAEPNVGGYAQIVGKDGDAIGNPGQGAPTFGANWIDNATLNSFHVVEGHAPEADDQVTIDAHAAKEGDLHVGDHTTVLTKAGVIEVEIVGIVKFGDVDSPGGASFVSFTTPAAQRYLAEPGKVNGVSVVAATGVSDEEVTARIAKILPKDLEVITGAELAEENKDDIQQFIDIIKAAMLVFAGIALFVGSFIIYNTFSILVAQRIREMALLRAIGASRAQVTMSVLLEALVVGAIAAVLGLVVGLGLAAGLKALLAGVGFEMPAAGLTLSLGTVIVGLVMGIGVSVVAAWFPARRGAKVPPIAAMRDVAFERRSRGSLRIIIGAAVGVLGLASLFRGLSGDPRTPLIWVGAGALLILIAVAALGAVVARPISSLLGRPIAATRGVTGELARENAMRNPRRTSTTAAALMIGVALVGFITIFASSAKASLRQIFEEQFTGDFVLDTDTFGFGGVSTLLEDDLRKLREIAAVSPLRITGAEFDGKGVQLTAVDASAMDQIADIGVLEGQLTDLDAKSVAILDEKAEDEDWHIGSTVPVRFTDTGMQELTVRVIYSENELAGRYFVDTAVFDANVHDQFDSVIFAKLAPGVAVEDARPAVDAAASKYPNVEVQDRDEFISDQSEMINQVLVLIYVLLALAIVIAFFGIMNTLALSMVERTRELGLLRAVGMTRRQLKSMVRWEAVLIALFGTVGGLGVGIFFGWSTIRALDEQGFHVFHVPIVGFVFIAVFAALFGVVAAMLPARRAAKLDILYAIASE